MGAASGLVAGLVAITPACGFVTPAGSVLIGGAAGVCCAFARAVKYRCGFDDSLDVVAVHLVGGIVGALSVGLLGRHSVNALGRDGLLFGGGPGLLLHQAIGVGAVLAFAFGATFAIAKVLDVIVGLRVPADVELAGLDAHLHGESAYHRHPHHEAPAHHDLQPGVASPAGVVPAVRAAIATTPAGGGAPVG
jgi:Amt family ammonium transporter